MVKHTAERPGADRSSISSRSEVLAELGRRIESQKPTLVFATKVAHLKAFNHAHGLAAGDELLGAMADRILALVDGSRSCVGSLRSDLFMMLVDATEAAHETLIDQIAGALGEPLQVGLIEHIPEMRIGVAFSESDETDIEELMIEVNAAVRVAVDTRQAVVIADDTIRRKAKNAAVIERDLEAVIDSGELSFAYQPLVALRDGAVHGAEALLRWNHPELGALSPHDVVARARALGLTERFSEWSVDRIAREWASVADSEIVGASVSINMHEEQLASPLFAPMLERVLDGYGLAPEHVVIEVVESGPVGIGNAAVKTLRAITEMGCPVVLDDFGTGFNALEYFLQFPIMGIKFDRCLTNSMRTNETARVIVEGVARIADELGVLTVAEGIESELDAANCRDIPITLGQGWHFGYPTDFGAFVDLARRSRHGIPASELHRATFSQQS